LRLRRAARPMLLACVLCVACGAIVAAVAIAAPRHRSSHHLSHTTRACHRHRAGHHRRCPAAGARKKSHGKRGAAAKPSAPTKGPGTTTPWTATPTPVIPGSTSGSGSGTGPGSTPGSPGETGPSPGSPTAPAGPAHVQVIATEYHLALSQTEVPTGKVIVNFVNDGQDEHNLNTAESAAAGAESSSVFAATKSGAHPELPINMHAGAYTLFCSLPGHRAKGMEATLVVR
jgi:plastocyanin